MAFFLPPFRNRKNSTYSAIALTQLHPLSWKSLSFHTLVAERVTPVRHGDKFSEGRIPCPVEPRKRLRAIGAVAQPARALSDLPACDGRNCSEPQSPLPKNRYAYTRVYTSGFPYTFNHTHTHGHFRLPMAKLNSNPLHSQQTLNSFQIPNTIRIRVQIYTVYPNYSSHSFHLYIIALNDYTCIIN